MTTQRATIKRIRASRVLVELPDGSEAWLSGQELSALYDPSIELSKQNLCVVGQKLDVVVFGSEVGGQKQLVSHVRAIEDPWNKVRNWGANDLKLMEVLSVTSTRAFGRIEPGIEGYVDLKEVDSGLCFPRTWANFKTIVPRDYLLGFVQDDGIDYDRRLVKLDVVSCAKSLEGITATLRPENHSGVIVEESPEPRVEASHFRGTVTGAKHCLIVDDNEAFLDGVSLYLRDLGVNVFSANSKADFIHFLGDEDHSDFEIAIVDLHLTRNLEYSGLEVVRLIEEHHPNSRIIIATAEDARFNPEALGKMIEMAGDVRISGLLYKPFGGEELRNAISEASTQQPLALKNFIQTNRKEQVLGPRHFDGAEENPLLSALRDLRDEIRAETVVLFSIHPLSYEVGVVAGVGSPTRLSSLYSFQSKLRYSPVRDVAIEREIIHENMIWGTKVHPKHRWLHRAIKYESCIACPVSVSSEFAYSLFTFHSRRDQFDENDRHNTHKTAMLVAKILEVNRLVEIRRTDDPFLIAGKTYGSMAHELVTALPNEFKLDEIERLLGDLTDETENRDKIERELRKLILTLKRAIEIVRTFRRMAGGQHETETEIDAATVISDVVELLKPDIQPFNIEVQVAPIDCRMSTKLKMRRAGLEQVVVNLVLNAAQQIQRFSFSRSMGWIRVQLSQVEVDDRSMLRILFLDSGPGVHGRDFKEVFQMGFTTRENGLGMGLDICQNIVSNAGGRIRIVKSILFVGTAFEVLLPLKV